MRVRPRPSDEFRDLADGKRRVDFPQVEVAALRRLCTGVPIRSRCLIATDHAASRFLADTSAVPLPEALAALTSEFFVDWQVADHAAFAEGRFAAGDGTTGEK